VFKVEDKERLLQKTMPQYIILKPSFIGGFRGTQEWISLAEKHHIGGGRLLRQYGNACSMFFYNII
jgi:L-alanine-DL-glutamate epimerase-like enolase superfamily enzyme